MFILTLTRWLAALASAAFLAGAAYLLWSWSQGQWVRDAAGQTWHVREPWRLWAAGLLFTWCALGRWVAPLLLAKGGGRATRSARSHGEVVPEATGSALYGERHGPADAPVIVFTHGWGMDSTFWDYARQDLGERFQLVLWDLPWPEPCACRRDLARPFCRGPGRIARDTRSPGGAGRPQHRRHDDPDPAARSSGLGRGRASTWSKSPCWGRPSSKPSPWRMGDSGRRRSDAAPH